MLRFDLCSYFLAKIGELSMCVIESVNSGYYVVMRCNCFVSVIVGSRKAAWNRRVR